MPDDDDHEDEEQHEADGHEHRGLEGPSDHFLVGYFVSKDGEVDQRREILRLAQFEQLLGHILEGHLGERRGRTPTL